MTLTRPQIVEHAIAIAEEYHADALTLTLRQMYYQFVARGLLPSGQKIYKRIGSTLTNARYNGDFPIDWLEDRGRSVDQGSFTTDQDDVDDALDNVANELRRAPRQWLWRSRWLGQPIHVSVWVEKEALSGIFEPACNDLHVSWFACKGYPSVSALNEWLGYVDNVHLNNDIEEAVVLYFGDHDPDGWEIPRSAARNIHKLRELEGTELNYDVTFKRIALNMDQIDEYEPPPFEAKVTSARYHSYVDEHDTEEAWELDALEPRVLRELIRVHVREHFDDSIHKENAELIRSCRREMRQRMRESDWMSGVFDDG